MNKVVEIKNLIVWRLGKTRERKKKMISKANEQHANRIN